MPSPEVKITGRVVQHNTKSSTKDGVDVLKVTFELENAIGGEIVRTPLTFATRAGEENADRYPLDETFEIVIRPASKSAKS